MNQRTTRTPRKKGQNPSFDKRRWKDNPEKELDKRLRDFLEGDYRTLTFEPMNSFLRRVLHKQAKAFKLKTSSLGEEPNRYVEVEKTSESKAPPPEESQSFSQRKEPRAWDYGPQNIPVEPGKEGLRLVLKTDGSLVIFREEKEEEILDSRLVTSRHVRVRQGKIVVPGEEAWGE